jgi:hypothetical protein
VYNVRVLTGKIKMKLRDEDKEWLRGEISAQLTDAIEEFRPHGWRKVAHWAREWGITGAIIGAFLTMAAITLGALYQSYSHLEKETEFRTKTTDHLVDIDNRLLVLQLSLSSAQPTKSQNQAAVKQLLADARARAVSISPAVIQEAGATFIQAGLSDPGAWDVAMHFLSYKSFLTSIDINSPLPPGTKLEETQYILPKGNFLQQPTMNAIGGSKAPDLPEVRRLDAANPNESVALGPSFLVIGTSPVVLDGLYLKRVIFKDTHIIYKGGPLTMENVYFINCTFEIQQQRQGQEFAQAVLSPQLNVKLTLT